MRSRLLAGLLLIMILSSIEAAPSNNIIITDINNQTHSGRNITIKDAKNCILLMPEAEGIFALDELIEIRVVAETISEPASTPGLYEFVLNNHDIICANLISGTPNSLIVKSPTLGTLNINYDQLLMIKTNPSLSEKISGDSKHDQDSIWLLNGDKDQGIVTMITPEKISLKSAIYNKERTYEINAVGLLMLAQLGAPPQETVKNPTQLITQDNSRITARNFTIINQSITLTTLDNQTFRVLLDKLKAICFQNPQCTYLSDLEPVEVKEYYPIMSKELAMIPFLWNYQKNKSVYNHRDISLHKQSYYKGLGVHADCELTYRLDGAYQKFFAAIGLDDESGPGGSVQFLVYADNKPIYKSNVFKWQTPAEPVALDIVGVKELKLVVNDAGDGLTMDRAAWASARVIK